MNRKKARILVLTTKPRTSEMFTAALDSDHHVVAVDEVGPLKPLLERGESGLVAVDAALPLAQLEEAADLMARFAEVPLLIVGNRSSARDRVGRGSPIDEVIEPTASAEYVREHVGLLLEKGRFLKGATLVGDSTTMRELRERILLVAPTPVAVLLNGESGTGKDDIAAALHHHSPRRHKPFKPINCGAIPENLIESELFGHEKGAFTDARNRRAGVFEQANGGTVFLDEIGEMALSAQVKLLRVLEHHEITRVGGDTAIPIDIRIVAASNRDLQQAVSRGEFRLDLYYRLKGVEWTIPPLRQRREDILALIDHFVARLGRKNDVRFKAFSPAALELLRDYDWPGNVRELLNLIEHLVFLGPRGRVEPADLLPHLERPPAFGQHLPVPTGKSPEQGERELIYFALLDLKREVSELRRLIEDRSQVSSPPHPPGSPVFPLEDAAITSEVEKEPSYGPVVGVGSAKEGRTLKEVEKELIQQTLDLVGGNRKRAAQILDIGVRTLYRKLDEYDLR